MISDLTLERFLLRELASEDAARVEAALRDDPELRARLQALENDSRETLEKHPPHLMAANIRARATQEAQKRGGLSYLWLVPMVSAAALTMFAYERGQEDRGSPVSQALEVTRQKGLAPHLVVFRQRGQEAEALRNGAEAKAGDVLQLSYVAAGERHGAVLSVDGRGAVTLHFPETERGSTHLEKEGVIPLARAYELDDAPSFERFFFVTSADALDVRALVETTKSAYAQSPRGFDVLPIAGGVHQSSFTVVKVQ